MGSSLRRIARTLDRRLHRRAETRVGRGANRDSFIATLERTGDLDLAAMAAARPLLRRGRIGRLRTVTQALARNPGTATAGDVTRALLALNDGQPDLAWQLLGAHDPARMLQLAPTELLRAGLAAAPDEASALLDQLQSGELPADLGPRAWRSIAEMTFAAGLEHHSRWALDNAVRRAGNRGPIAKDAEALRRWYDRRPSGDCRLPALEHGQTAIAVLTGDLVRAGPELRSALKMTRGS